MDQPKKKIGISVIIPTYNEETHIKKCLDALSNQTVQIDEIIVVDNNSSDSTREIVKSYKGVKLISEKRQGQVFARATGFDRAKHQIIATIDADTVVYDNWAETIKDSIYNKGYDAVSTYVSLDESVVESFFSWAFNIVAYELNRYVVGHKLLFGSNMAITKEYWLKAKDLLHFDPNLWEDYELAAIGYKLGYKIGLIRSQTANISIRRSSPKFSSLLAYYLQFPRTFKYYGLRPYILSSILAISYATGLWVYSRFILKPSRQIKQVQKKIAFKFQAN